MKCRQAALVLIALLVGCAPTGNRDDPASVQAVVTKHPTAEELIRLAPVVSLNNARYSTFHWKADLGPMRWKWELFYRQPDQVSFLELDSKDGTPLTMIVNNNGLLYDAAGGKVWIGRSRGYSVQLVKTVDQKLFFGCGFRTDGQNILELDLPAVFAGLKCNVVSAGSATYLVTGVSDSGRGTLTAHFDLSKACALTSVELLTNDPSNKPIRFDFSANESIPDWAWGFPSRRSIDPKLPMANLSELPAVPLLLISLASPLFRIAADEPALRPKFEQQFGKFDWQRAKDRDAKISPMLRKMISDLGVQNQVAVGAP